MFVRLRRQSNRLATRPGLSVPSTTSKALAKRGLPDVSALLRDLNEARKARAYGDVPFPNLVVYSGPRPEFDTPPIDVDVRGYEAGDVERLIAQGHDLLGWAVRLGLTVYDKHDYWSRLTERWRSSLPFPSALVAEQRALKASQLLDDLVTIGDEDAALEQLVSMLTHRARVALLRAGVYPASRPELPEQLLAMHETALARDLRTALERRNALIHSSRDVGAA